MLSKNFSRFSLIAICWFGFSTAHAIPDIQKWQTANGVSVLFVESPILPMLDIRVVFDAGSARDDGLSGLANLTNGLLVEGSDGLTAQEIAENFESVGAKIDVGSLRDMAYVGLRSLTEPRYLDVALSGLKKVLTRPDFNQRAFERDIARMKVAVEAGKQSPSAIAEGAFYRAIYGDHPYATPVGGDEKTLDAIRREDVLAFYKKYYVAKNAQIFIVGAITRERAEAIANDIVTDIKSGEKPQAIPEVLPLKESKTIAINFPSKQSHILMGQPGMKRGDEDYFTLYVANHPFGGSGFASRLLGKIREEHGLAYSVYSYFSPMRKSGPFTMGMQTRNDQKDEALSLLKSELENYIAQGPADDELKSSISNIVGSFPLNLDNNSKLLGYIAMIGFYGLPTDYLDNFVSNINSVKQSDIKSTIKRRINTDKLVTVVVGNGSE